MTTKVKRVGVLSEWNPSAYSRNIGYFIEERASALGIQVAFLGVEWASSEQVEEEALERSLSWASEYDAMILLSGVFSHGVSGLSRFSQRWAPRPLLSLGYRLPGVASLLVDNRAATREATSHLIEKHGRRNLLFVRGRKDSHESEERYLGFRHALRDHGLIHDEKRILAGDFTRRGAIRALGALDKKVIFDGIVTANDDMALAAMADMKRRGLVVPDDVAVVGFDDVPQASQGPIPLSTLAQPFEQMARIAFDGILEQAEGTRSELARAIPLDFVARASCGCG